MNCHTGESAEGDLRLDALRLDFSDRGAYRHWVAVFECVLKGEMPPPDVGQPEDGERERMLDQLRHGLEQANLAARPLYGRVQYCRINRVESENRLRDLLSLPDLEVSEILPPDGSAYGFDTVGSALDLSYVQMSRYLDAANTAQSPWFWSKFEPPVDGEYRLRMKSFGFVRNRVSFLGDLL